MITLEATFRCACPAVGCEEELDAADWETALAEVRLMRCRHGEHLKYVIRNVVLIEYDEQGYLTDLDLVAREQRSVNGKR